MKDKKLFNFLLTDELKSKLISDSIKYNFPSMTSYLEKLIKTGLPFSESLETRLKYIEKKIDILFDDIRTLKGDINRRTFLTFRIVCFILARSFYIKPGAISESDIKEANKFIEDAIALR